jgi:hypothetical protein
MACCRSPWQKATKELIFLPCLSSNTSTKCLKSSTGLWQIAQMGQVSFGISITSSLTFFGCGLCFAEILCPSDCCFKAIFFGRSLERIKKRTAARSNEYALRLGSGVSWARLSSDPLPSGLELVNVLDLGRPVLFAPKNLAGTGSSFWRE